MKRLRPARGIGAARDWLFAEFQKAAATSGGRMTVELQSYVQPPASRIPVPTTITNVVATLRGDQPASTGRTYVVSGHYDSICSDPGLAEVTVGEVAVPLRAASFEQWWARTTSLAGPMAARLSMLPEESARRLDAAARDAVAAARDAVAAYQTPAGLEFPGVALLAAARRP